VALAEAESEFSVVHHDAAAGLAELVRDGTWSDIMDRAGINISSLIDGIFQTATDGFATTLASGLEQGLSSSAIAASISDMVDANAQMIATTETARAQSAATSDVYTESGITQYEWLAEDSACSDGKDRTGCLSLAENGPYEMPPDDGGDNEDQPSQPWHPNCRCTYLPVIPDITGENIAPTSEEGDQSMGGTEESVA
jgi:SPP1 gp7 family putative phage head morphogenesis protein